MKCSNYQQPRYDDISSVRPVGSFRMFQRALQRKRAAGESNRQTGLGLKTIGVHAVVSCAQACHNSGHQ